MREISIRRFGVTFAALLAAVSFFGCRSDQYTQEKAVERARAFLLEESPELTVEQIYFVKFTEPVLLVGEVIGSSGMALGNRLESSQRQICPTWMIPGQDKLYMVFGVSSGRMSSWEPIRLIRKNFERDAYKALNSAWTAAQQFAVDNFYRELDVTQLNRIRLYLPYILETDFEYMIDPSFKLNPEAPKVGDAQRLKNKAQRSLVWYLDGNEEDAIVFCGFSAPDLTGWTINWAGRMKKEELKKHILKVIKTPADANTPIVIEPESKPETARK